jgi:hypothetical protein
MACPRLRLLHTACSGLAIAIPSTAGWLATVSRDWAVYAFAKDEGASPLFPPQHAEEETAKEALLHVVRRDPHQCGVQQSRWRLADLIDYCTWLTLETESGMSQLLKRVGIHDKRGREHVHRPDPFYQAKIDAISALKKEVEQKQSQEVFLYLDELTYYRQPSLARAYEEAGEARPYAQRSLLSNTATRVVGT